FNDAPQNPAPIPAQVITVTNQGSVASAALTITPGAPNFDQFAITSDGCSGTVLSPSGSCTFTVQFNPNTTANNLYEVLNIGPAGQLIQLWGTGNGVAVPQLSITPT